MKITSKLAAVVVAVLAACGHGAGSSPDATTRLDAGVSTPDASCFDITGMAHPSHYQIINACTTADKIVKDSHPPLLNPDGSLPPLPTP